MLHYVSMVDYDLYWPLNLFGGSELDRYPMSIHGIVARPSFICVIDLWQHVERQDCVILLHVVARRQGTCFQYVSICFKSKMVWINLGVLPFWEPPISLIVSNPFTSCALMFPLFEVSVSRCSRWMKRVIFLSGVRAFAQLFKICRGSGRRRLFEDMLTIKKSRYSNLALSENMVFQNPRGLPSLKYIYII